jgi:hypothetical protein
MHVIERIIFSRGRISAVITVATMRAKSKQTCDNRSNTGKLKIHRVNQRLKLFIKVDANLVQRTIPIAEDRTSSRNKWHVNKPINIQGPICKTLVN